MRRLVIAILALTVLSGVALAHTPAGVAVSYNESSGDLGVTITHQVDDPATHYVKSVTVREVRPYSLTNPTPASRKNRIFPTLPFPRLKGSSGEIRADVECNIFGSRSGTLYLAGTTAADPPWVRPLLPQKHQDVFLVPWWQQGWRQWFYAMIDPAGTCRITYFRKLLFLKHHCSR